jgi:tetratricopeptide (TPR) repeat protein
VSRTVRVSHLAVGIALFSIATALPLHGQVLLPGIRGGNLPTPAESEFRAGVAALEANNLAAAEEAFKRSLSLDKGAAGPHLGLAQVALRRNAKSEAEAHLKEAVTVAPSNASTQTAWGTYLFREGDYPDAEAALRKALSVDPKAVAARIHLGDIYLTAFRKPAEAAQEYRAALAIAPEHPGAHYALGLTLMELNDAKGAEAELLTAIKIAGNNPLPHHALGRLYALQKQQDKALAEFDAAIKLARSFAAPHLERGHILLARGDDAGAIREYNEAQKKDPKRALGLMFVGMTHQQKQRWADAQQAYLGAVKIDPQNAVAYNNLAWMAAERKSDLKQAATWAQRAVTINKDIPEFQGTLGWVYRGLGDLERAERTLQAAAAMKPQRASVVALLGRVYFERGKKTEAAAELKRALALDPNFAGADEARRILKQLGQA